MTYGRWPSSDFHRPSTAFNIPSSAMHRPSSDFHVPSESSAQTPLTILGAGGGILHWARSDLGVEASAGVPAVVGVDSVTNWLDQSGNGQTFTEASTKPTYVVGAGGRPALQFDGASQKLDCTTLVPAAPGTTPMFIWSIVEAITWTNGDPIYSSITAATFVMELFQNGTTPNVACFNGSTGPNNANLVLTTPRRVEDYYNNAVSDYLKIGTTSVTGTNKGNSSGGGGRRLAGDNGTTRGNIRYYELLHLSRLPSAGELSQLDAYASGRYGAGVLG